ncbi:MAG: hypothetical protein QXT45_04745 [Candidatus Bilamarchaeaceae archaeon]
MIKDSEQRSRLEQMIKQAEVTVARLRAERSELPVGSIEWVWADEALFEARCTLRNLRTALRMTGRAWECERCGQRYGPEWVAAWGLRCDAECDGDLVEFGGGGLMPNYLNAFWSAEGYADPNRIPNEEGPCPECEGLGSIRSEVPLKEILRQMLPELMAEMESRERASLEAADAAALAAEWEASQ